jgi:two-component system sensor histidine kinase UhpB
MPDTEPITGATVRSVHAPRRPRLSGGSLRVQLLASTAVPTILLLLALIGVSALAFTRLTQALIRERDSVLVQLAAQQVASYVNDSLLLLSQLASTNEVRDGDAPAITALLEANVALRLRFDAISVTDSLGGVIATTGGTLGEQVGDRAFFERARRLRRPIKSAIYVSQRGEPVISVAVPVYDRLRRFGGCLLGEWRLHGVALGLPVGNVRVGERGFAYLVDETGRIIYHPSADQIESDARQHPAVAALLRGEVGAQTVQSRGVTSLVGYAPLPLSEQGSSLLADDSWRGWGLLTAEYWGDIVRPLRPYAIPMVALALAVLSLPVVVLAVNSRRITAPVSNLAEQVERVAAGQFDTQVSVTTGPQEVRDLEMAFNAMVTQLRRYRADIQDYVVAVLNSQEQERMRVARELHDETAQALVVLGRRIEAAQAMATTPALYGELDRVRDLVDDTLQGVRRFTSDLRPPLLEELGLARTLEILGNRTGREERIAVDVRLLGEARPLPASLELGLYRLAQEGLNNVRRHADASHVALTLTYGEGAVRLELTDDGVGFDVPGDTADLMRMGRMGLMGIHERARLFGGQADIRSRPGQGTTVTVTIPLSGVAVRNPDEANAAPSPAPRDA